MTTKQIKHVLQAWPLCLVLALGQARAASKEVAQSGRRTAARDHFLETVGIYGDHQSMDDIIPLILDQVRVASPGRSRKRLPSLRFLLLGPIPG